MSIIGPKTEKEWKHWKTTFHNYVTAYEAVGEVNKLDVLTKFLSCTVYEHIDGCQKYDDAIRILDNLYSLKGPDEVFARHLLATAKQQPGHSLKEFLQELRRLSKNRNFRAVSQKEHRDGFFPDAFISGISSHVIRQRLLEESILTMLLRQTDRQTSLFNI